MSNIEQSQVNMVVQMLAATDRYKNTDFSKPVLMFLPLDEQKHKDTVLLDMAKLSKQENMAEGLNNLKEAKVQRFQSVIRFPDGSDACPGDYLLEEDKVGGQPTATFLAKMKTWADRATANPSSAKQFWASFAQSTEKYRPS